MKIAVTGLSGTLGRHFPTNVVGLNTRLESSVNDMLKELNSHPQIDCLIHLAAMMLVTDCSANPEKAHELNVNAALRWLEASGKANIKHFIFVSTSHVFGNPFSDLPLPTSYKLNPVSVYGKTKADAEIKLAELAQKFSQTKFTIAHLFSVVSRKSRPELLYANLHRRAQQKDFSPVPGLFYVPDFITADDAVERLIDLASWTNAPSVVHICTGNGRTVLDLATEVFNEYGLNANELLSDGPKGPNDIPCLIGIPTVIPST